MILDVAVGFLVVLVVGLGGFSTCGVVFCIFSLAKYIVEGIIETYKQADTVYLDSFAKKDTVINVD
jgi:hypothetical protein